MKKRKRALSGENFLLYGNPNDVYRMETTDHPAVFRFYRNDEQIGSAHATYKEIRVRLKIGDLDFESWPIRKDDISFPDDHGMKPIG